jgi:hypothetical protein
MKIVLLLGLALFVSLGCARVQVIAPKDQDGYFHALRYLSACAEGYRRY